MLATPSPAGALEKHENADLFVMVLQKAGFMAMFAEVKVHPFKIMPKYLDKTKWEETSKHIGAFSYRWAKQ